MSSRAAWPAASVSSAPKRVASAAAGSVMPWPTSACVPALCTRTPSPCRRARSRTSAIGERQMFPVQTVRMVASATAVAGATDAGWAGGNRPVG
nr:MULTISPECIES: hypothetical protein [Microbacterium]